MDKSELRGWGEVALALRVMDTPAVHPFQQGNLRAQFAFHCSEKYYARFAAFSFAFKSYDPIS